MRRTELGGKTLGILGVGTIGKSVARLAGTIGMNVVGYDPFSGPEYNSESEIPLASLELVLRQVDFVSIHSSGNSEAGYVLDSDHLKMMNKGAYLINTADCSALGEAALLELVETHSRSGPHYVHVSQPKSPNNPLLVLDNAIVTPHIIVGATKETIDRHSWTKGEEIQRFIPGRRPMDLANPEVWESRG